jgi:hypothetical protein
VRSDERSSLQNCAVLDQKEQEKIQFQKAKEKEASYGRAEHLGVNKNTYLKIPRAPSLLEGVFRGGGAKDKI